MVNFILRAFYHNDKEKHPSSAPNPAGPPPEAESKAPSQHGGPVRDLTSLALPTLVHGRTGLLFSLFLSRGRLTPTSGPFLGCPSSGTLLRCCFLGEACPSCPGCKRTPRPQHCRRPAGLTWPLSHRTITDCHV